MPDREARQRARRAAVAEFERIHAVKETPAPAARTSRRAFFGPLSWASRNVWMGGVATACVVVIGVSVVWLMPARDREPHFNVSMAPKDQQPALPAARTQRPAASDRPAAASTQQPAASTQPPAASNGPAAVSNPRPAANNAPLAANTEPAASAKPAPKEEQKSSRAARDERVVVATLPEVQPQPEIPPPAVQLAMPAPAASAPQEKDKLNEVVTVTGSRIRRRSFDSESPVVTVDAGAAGTAEDARTSSPAPMTGASAMGGFRQASAASAPFAPPPPPPAEGRDKFEHFDTNPVKRVADEPVSTFSVDVDTAAYSFVRRRLNEGFLPQMDAVRVEEMINYFDYSWPVPTSREEPFKPTVVVTDSPWGAGKKLIHIGIKGYALPVRERPDVNLVLLLDVSGSMDEPDKLPLAQRSMALLLDTLKPTDTVAIVVYAGAAGEVLPPTPVKNKETILHALESLRPGGSTAGAEGIRLAYQLAERNFRKEGVNRILLATDGDFNVGITDRNELKGFVEREREKGVYLSVLGFGEGNYRDEMAQTLAQNGNGVAAYIDTLNEAKKVLVQESSASLFTIAKDVKLQVEFNPATVAEYRLVGYETRALKREDFNNDKVDAGDVGSGHTVTAIYEITPVDSKARLMDETRYAAATKPADSQGKANEYGFLRIRYKLPNESSSRLLEQPILTNAGVPAALKDDVAFSTAVAGFAQLLRGGKYTGSLSYEDVLSQAQRAIGSDPFGYRAEFVQLVGRAQHARGL
jgi:Ca-activated chloride channel family protein